MGVLLWHAAAADPLNYRNLLARPRATATERVTYGSAPSEFADLWLPDSAAKPAVVVLIHGGCWQSGFGLELMAYLAQDLRRHGVAVWNVEYRRLGDPGGGYPGTFTDIGHALDRLRDVAARHPLDLDHVVLVGHSAGGQLALWAAARNHLPTGSPLAVPDPLPVSAVVSLAGIDDLAAYRADGPEACGGPKTIDELTDAEHRPKEARYADTSPTALLPIGRRQLIVSGRLDPIVPPRFGRAYAVAARLAGDPVDEDTIPEAGHFELIDPQSAAWTEIRPRVRALAGAH